MIPDALLLLLSRGIGGNNMQVYGFIDGNTAGSGEWFGCTCEPFSGEWSIRSELKVDLLEATILILW